MNPQQNLNIDNQNQAVGPINPTGQADATVSQVQAAPGQTSLTAAPKGNPNSTQNTLSIAEIRDGIVIMNDGSYRSVVMAQSINFDLMSPAEQEAVEYSYQGFLNALYFPIQIHIRSKRVDMRPYMEKLDRMRIEQENMLLGVLMDDYIDYIDMVTQQTNIMSKQFYIVIPYFNTVDISKPVEAGKKVFGSFFEVFKINQPATQVVAINEADLEKAKAELRNRVQGVLSGLNQIGVRGVPLDTQELIELYYDAYNPDTATRQTLRNSEDLSVPIIEKATTPPEGVVGGGM